VKNRSTAAKLLIVLLVSLVAMFTVHAALAKDNPPGCKNTVPGPNGYKNPNCSPEGPEFGNCNDGIDNDNDGLTDGADPDCQTPPTQEGPPGDATCSDGIDNDQDGATDGADSDCQTPPTTEGPPGDPTCTDGIDNDQDGATDGADSGCQTATVNHCTAAADDPGLLTTNTLGQEIWDGGGDALSPLTEDPEHNGVISGPLNDALDDTPLEVVGDEASCAADLLLDETVSPIDP